MARLDGGRFNRWIEKFFNIKQPGASITGVEDSIRPVVSLPSGQEDRYIQGWNIFGTTATSSAVAAQLSGFTLSNPANSGIIAVVQKVVMLPGATALCQMFNNNVAFIMTTQINPTGIRMDKRTNLVSVCNISKGTASLPAEGGACALRMLGITTGNAECIVNPNQEWVLLPNDSITVLCELVNTALSVTMQWRERVLESSELI